MKYKHYAPKCRVVLVDAPDGDAYAAYVNANGKGNYGVLAAEEETGQFSTGSVLSLGKASDADEHARRLFALLREADERDLETLYARLPSENGIDLAYYNRIIRAAGGEIVKL